MTQNMSDRRDITNPIDLEDLDLELAEISDYECGFSSDEHDEWLRATIRTVEAHNDVWLLDDALEAFKRIAPDYFDPAV